ncbi:hypothetical protein BJ742DRAFT_214946, partial [Cladochytrium replicatum]
IDIIGDVSLFTGPRQNPLGSDFLKSTSPPAVYKAWLFASRKGKHTSPTCHRRDTCPFGKPPKRRHNELQLPEQQEKLCERDTTIAEQKTKLDERDATIAERDLTIETHKGTLREMHDRTESLEERCDNLETALLLQKQETEWFRKLAMERGEQIRERKGDITLLKFDNKGAAHEIATLKHMAEETRKEINSFKEEKAEIVRGMTQVIDSLEKTIEEKEKKIKDISDESGVRQKSW